MGRRIAWLTALLLWLAAGAGAVTFGAPISLEAPQEEPSAPAFDVTVNWDEAAIAYTWDANTHGWVQSESGYTTITLQNNATEAVSATLAYQATGEQNGLLSVAGLSDSTGGTGGLSLTVELPGNGSRQAYLLYNSSPPTGDVSGDIEFTIATQVSIALAAGGSGT